MTLRIFFYVQHLLGVGHVFRAKRIADACIEAGHHVTFVLGGRAIPTLGFGKADVIQLPAIHAGDGEFTNLIQSDGQPLTDEFKAERARALQATFDADTPDVLVLEAYPFARRALRFELLPLLEAAHARAPRPLILSSVRDILQQPSSEAKAAQAIDIFETYFDGALVHGDPAVARLEDSYPPLARSTDRHHYTGVVAPKRISTNATLPGDDRSYDVLVSAGGGAVGARLIRTAISSKPLTSLADARWLVLTGPNLPQKTQSQINAQAAAAGIDVETFRPDLPELLSRARLSIQQAGYNTVADLLQTKCRAVLVPYAERGETEQATRAAFLEQRGRVSVIEEARLSPQTMATAVESAMQRVPSRIAIAMDGAATSARLIEDLFKQHRRTAASG